MACHIRLFGGPHRSELYVEIVFPLRGCDAKSVRLNTGAMRIEVEHPTLCAVLCRGCAIWIQTRQQLECWAVWLRGDIPQLMTADTGEPVSAPEHNPPLWDVLWTYGRTVQ